MLDGSAYGIEQSDFAVVRQRPCRAQNARNVFVSYHRTPSLFIDFAISFAINLTALAKQKRALAPAKEQEVLVPLGNDLPSYRLTL